MAHVAEKSISLFEFRHGWIWGLNKQLCFLPFSPFLGFAFICIGFLVLQTISVWWNFPRFIRFLYLMLPEGLISFLISRIRISLCKRILVGHSWATCLSWNTFWIQGSGICLLPSAIDLSLGQEILAPWLIVLLELRGVEQSMSQKEVLWAKQNSNSWLLHCCT